MILVIEDEEEVRELVEAVLAGHSHVLTAESFEQAEALWSERKDDIKLVLSDLRLSEGVFAPTFLAHWQQEKPSLPVVYMSGLSTDEDEGGPKLVEGVNFLPKPFSTRELIRLVSSAGAWSEEDEEFTKTAACL